MPIATINPTTGATVTEFEPHGAPEIERRIADSRAACEAMQSSSFADRSRWMRAAADLG
jgi:succinate-semialdehyde dehydrogenase / glutarate-semialdehyde dehydrogenase